ncbi:MAG: DUF1569 domain-containing protein [Bryobacterales bacterium]|nr:DUF1569 domain-containing protein [Bryobacterales bacterium]
MPSLADPALRDQLLVRIAAVQPGSPRQWGRMTVHGMLCHLTDSFLSVTGDRPIQPASSLLGRTVMKWGALYLPFPWPKGVPTRPEVDQERRGTPPTDFQQDKARLLDAFHRFANHDMDGRAHPIFGPLTQAQWQRWGYLHVDHHLRQFSC